VRRFLARFIGYLRGDLDVWDRATERPQWPPVGWIQGSSGSAELADYALEATSRSADRASAAVDQIQGKASSLVGFLLTLIPIGAAATALAYPGGRKESWIGWIGFLLFCATDVLLVSGAVLAFLSSGEVFAGGFNPARVGQQEDVTVPSLKAAEADAWYFATELAMWTAYQKAQDLFLGRRLVLVALLVSVPAAVLFVAAR
jgi:hypothetical protein